jgi:hypothetical protein
VRPGRVTFADGETPQLETIAAPGEGPATAGVGQSVVEAEHA